MNVPNLIGLSEVEVILNTKRSGGKIPEWAKRFGITAYPLVPHAGGFVYGFDRAEVELAAAKLRAVQPALRTTTEPVVRGGRGSRGFIANAAVLEVINRISERLDHIEANIDRLMAALGEGERQ